MATHTNCIAQGLGVAGATGEGERDSTGKERVPFAYVLTTRTAGWDSHAEKEACGHLGRRSKVQEGRVVPAEAIAHLIALTMALSCRGGRAREWPVHRKS